MIKHLNTELEKSEMEYMKEKGFNREFIKGFYDEEGNIKSEPLSKSRVDDFIKQGYDITDEKVCDKLYYIATYL